MVNKRFMRKFDTCVGHEARINKLLLKKPPGILSADSTSITCERCASKPFKALMNRGERKKINKRQRKNMKGGQRKETNSESGTSRRIFGDGLRSMGSARVGYLMHFVDGTLRQPGLDR